MLVTPRLASHLLARAALYPGLSELVTDMVSGGVGSELYRIEMPADHVGLGVDESSRKLRDENHATLLAIRRGGETFVNPNSEFVIADGDEALVVAEKLGKLSPVRAAEAKRAAMASATGAGAGSASSTSTVSS